MSSKRTHPLNGTWRFELDPEDVGIDENWFDRSLKGSIDLPGTTDEHRKGPENAARESRRLTRLHPYAGPAFYQRELHVPDEWLGKRLIFRIERTKHSTVWVNDNLVGSRDSLTTPHTYDMTEFLAPGRHRLTVRIDNSNNPPIGDPHQISEHTQTNWNGLLGQIELLVGELCRITDVQAYPDVKNKRVKLRLTFNTACIGQVAVSATAENTSRAHSIEQVFEGISADSGNRAEVSLVLGDGMQCWDEFSPTLYRLVVSFRNEDFSDCRELRIGMREFSARDGQFRVNGRATFLRGKHDACVFPLTGYAPMDVAEWRRILRTAKYYGINHYRFHSYCPPRAAFKAADEVGIYMQPELPLWESLGKSNVDPMGDVEFRGSGDDSLMERRIRYLVSEGLRILREFGNHPSFCMFALGNELSGDLDVMASFVKRFRQEDPRHLYAHGSNNFIWEPKRGPADDYWTTMMTGGHYRAGDFKPDSEGLEVRGSYCVHTHGHVNNRYPGTTRDYSRALQGVDVPVVAHEVGQYQVFPDFDEISKYTGVLRARNLELFKESLERAGMFDLAQDFFRASGMLAAICYREEIEAALRTPGFGGFQLLDIQDFPGQGTALVGILDAFMDSKGLISPERWREFCSDVVVLAKIAKYTWTRAETFAAELCMANYGPRDFTGRRVVWRLTTPEGTEVASGQTGPCAACNAGVSSLGTIMADLSSVECPRRLSLEILLEDTEYRNSYPLWVYEATQDADAMRSSVRVSGALDEDTIACLREGGSVLLLPDNKSVTQSMPGAFQSDFWCYPMFRKYNPPGTMGILCDPNHPALSEFPTEYHSNWQWWSLLKNGCSMILDALPEDLQPIVRVIDNVERNHRLGAMFECRVAGGKLLVCSCGLLQQQKYPEARQLQASLLLYMNSDHFDPACEIGLDALRDLID